MAWFALARCLFVAAVAYAAAILQPLPVGLLANVGFALASGRPGRPVRMLPARDRHLARARRAHRVRHRPRRSPAPSTPVCSGPTAAIARVEFLHSFILIVLPYLGLVLGGKHGEWLEPARLVSLFRADRPAAPLQDSRHQRHHRRPHRRRLRDRLRRRHAGHPAVRAEGAAAGRRLRRLDEAQPRAPRPRHPAEDPEDGRRRGRRSRTSISRTCAKSI